MQQHDTQIGGDMMPPAMAIFPYQQMMTAASAEQQSHASTFNVNASYDPEVLMKEVHAIIQAMEFRLIQFTQQLMVNQPNILEPGFASELQKHYNMFHYLLLQKPNNQYNPIYQQIGQVLWHFMQQKAAMEQHPVVKTGTIVNPIEL